MSVDLSAFQVSVLNGLSGPSFEFSMSPCNTFTFRHLRDRINDLYGRPLGTSMMLSCRDRNHAVLLCGQCHQGEVVIGDPFARQLNLKVAFIQCPFQVRGEWSLELLTKCRRN